MRRQGPKLPELYAAAERFRDQALGSDGSLFTPSMPIWSAASLADLTARFVDHPDDSSDRFLPKLERQLADAPDGTVQLAAEALYVHLLVAGNIGPAVKREQVQTVLAWSSNPVPIPPALDAALEGALAHAGTAYSTLRPYQLGFLIAFAAHWKGQADQAEAALVDPWYFKRILFEVPVEHGAYAQREALLHLVHPDAFEPILSRTVKQQIVASFRDAEPGESAEDVDRQLLAIRRMLTDVYGEGFSFYDPEVASTWRASVGEASRRYVKIAPGEGAEWWGDSLSSGYIAVGWGSVGDLRQFASREAYKERYAELFPYGGNRGQVTRKSNELWTLKELAPGDIVVANRGASEILAVGTVIEPGYDYLPERGESSHVVYVDWDTSKARKIAPVGAWKTRTVMDLTKEQVREFVTGTVPQAFTDKDFEVLQRHQDSKSWSAIPHEDQTALGLLRKKVQDYASYFQQQLVSTAGLTAFVSILNPNGRAPRDYWGCVYPEAAGNKSYAFQIFLIVGPEGIEYGFGAGSGDSQVKDSEKTQALADSLAAARTRLAATRGAQWWPDMDEALKREGFSYRSRWRAPHGVPMAGYEEWLSLASGPTGGGAAIGKWITSADAVQTGRRLPAEMVKQVTPLVRLMDAIYRPSGSLASNSSLSDLAITLSLQPEYLEDVRWLLQDQRQLVFYGPPGTGKTFVAEAFAEWFAGDPNRVEVVQFHPSYAYEDFVEGIRPDLEGKELRYRLVPGVLRRIASLAHADSTNRYVLIVDEINRAHLARVFGELLYLLEYRTKSVTLPYSQERFSLPENLYVIGTMNTADRSVALVDFALRRRFHFIEFPADEEILRAWLTRHCPDMVQVADYVGRVNDRLGRRDFQIGFSYFMRDDLDEELLERVWARSVIPALEEYFYSDPSQVDQYRLSVIRMTPATTPANTDQDVTIGAPPLAPASGDSDGETVSSAE